MSPIVLAASAVMLSALTEEVAPLASTYEFVMPMSWAVVAAEDIYLYLILGAAQWSFEGWGAGWSGSGRRPLSR